LQKEKHRGKDEEFGKGAGNDPFKGYFSFKISFPLPVHSLEPIKLQGWNDGGLGVTMELKRTQRELTCELGNPSRDDGLERNDGIGQRTFNYSFGAFPLEIYSSP